MFTDAYVQGCDDAAEMIFKVAMENGASEEKAFALAKLAEEQAKKTFGQKMDAAGAYVKGKAKAGYEGAKRHVREAYGVAKANKGKTALLAGTAGAAGAYAKKKYDER